MKCLLQTSCMRRGVLFSLSHSQTHTNYMSNKSIQLGASSSGLKIKNKRI